MLNKTTEGVLNKAHVKACLSFQDREADRVPWRTDRVSLYIYNNKRREMPLPFGASVAGSFFFLGHLELRCLNLFILRQQEMMEAILESSG